MANTVPKKPAFNLIAFAGVCDAVYKRTLCQAIIRRAIDDRLYYDGCANIIGFTKGLREIASLLFGVELQYMLDPIHAETIVFTRFDTKEALTVDGLLDWFANKVLRVVYPEVLLELWQREVDNFRSLHRVCVLVDDLNHFEEFVAVHRLGGKCICLAHEAPPPDGWSQEYDAILTDCSPEAVWNYLTTEKLI